MRKLNILIIILYFSLYLCSCSNENYYEREYKEYLYRIYGDISNVEIDMIKNEKSGFYESKKGLKYYYFGENVKNKIVSPMQVDDKYKKYFSRKLYANSDGYIEKNYFLLDYYRHTYYFDNEGIMVKKAWIKLDDKTKSNKSINDIYYEGELYFNRSGYLTKEKCIENGEERIYKPRWEKDEKGKQHYYRIDGSLVTNQILTLNQKKVYVDENGEIVQNYYLQDYKLEKTVASFYFGNDGYMVKQDVVFINPNTNSNKRIDGKYFLILSYSGTVESKNLILEKEEEVETRKKVSIRHETEEYYISDINKEDYDIINFNDDREKEIYGFYGIWINKENNKKYKEGNYGIDEFGDLITSDDIIVLMKDFEYEYYLTKKSYIDSIGLEQCYKDYTQPLDLVYDMCKKDAMYKGRYLSDKFIEKYGDKNGLLYNYDFDEVEIDTESYDYELDDRLNIGNQSYLSLLLIKGKKKTRIIVLCDLESGTNLLEDIEIRDVRVVMNENGEKVKLRMDENNWLNCIERLAFSDDDDEVGKSDRFVSEHPNFNGIIPNTLDVYPQTISQYELNFENEKCSYIDKKVVLDFYDKRKGRTDKYIIVYSIDNNMYINTYKIIEKKMISEDEYNPKADANMKYGVYSFDCKVRLIENNRDISKLPLTQNFIDNNFEKFDILHKIDMIDFDSPRQNNKIALTLIDSYKNKYFYGLIFKIVDNLIDDVEIIPLDIKEFPAGDAAFDLF